MRKNYTAEEKQAVIDKYRSGVVVTEIAKSTGVARNTIYRWIEEDERYKKKSEKVNMRDYAALKQKCEQQEKMIEILQAASCMVSAPLKDRFARMKRSAPVLLRVPKARFIGRSPASRVAKQLASCTAGALHFQNKSTCSRKCFCFVIILLNSTTPCSIKNQVLQGVFCNICFSVIYTN